MTYVVGEACVNCKFTDCVETCPVDCFYEGPNMLVIDPDGCIDCGACEPACPAEAIFDEDDLPLDQKEYIEINAKYSKKWPNIDKMKPSMPDAKTWKDAKDKRKLLILDP